MEENANRLTQSRRVGKRGGCLIVLLLAIVVCGILSRFSSQAPNHTPRVEGTTGTAASKPVDTQAQIMQEARAVARENYISNMRAIFRDGGVDATISDVGGELTIVADPLKIKPNRDHFMRQEFGPTVRRSLCTLGFKTVALKSGVLFGDGDSYSLGCPETKEEREARLQEERSARQKYVDDVQNDFNHDPQSSIHVTQRDNELILTGFAKDLSPATLRAMWAALMSDSDKKNLCGIGFRAVRMTADDGNGGTLISLGCQGKPK
jgi:hypothetical protein